MVELLRDRNDCPIFFVRRGPSAEELQFLLRNERDKIELRVMPSLFFPNDLGEGIIKPLLERMLTVRVNLGMLAAAQESQRYYQITGKTVARVCYDGMLPNDAPDSWHKRIFAQTSVQVNYDCYDRVGELYRQDDDALLPFPANFQCICAPGGDYHVVRAL